MKLDSGIKVLRLLASRPEGAMTTRELWDKWNALGSEDLSIRSIQRHMNELSAGSDGSDALVDVIEDGSERRYYLRTSEVARWFISEEDALDLLLSRQTLEKSMAGALRTQPSKLSDIAAAADGKSRGVRRLSECVRILPDGIGRGLAKVHPPILRATLDALAGGKKLSMSYTNQSGKKKQHVVSPLGLVAKDGTMYLVANRDLSDRPIHFALQRADEAIALHQPSRPIPGFDLDRHIDDTHQFSHKLGGYEDPVALKLRVAPEALFHFKERPLARGQRISGIPDSKGWFAVTVNVPVTMQLFPFLLSMGPEIEVLGPAEVREKVAARSRGMAEHYAATGK